MSASVLLKDCAGAHAATALAVGATVTARHRPYGLEFSEGATPKPFFLALADDWFAELQSRPVPL